MKCVIICNNRNDHEMIIVGVLSYNSWLRYYLEVIFHFLSYSATFMVTKMTRLNALIRWIDAHRSCTLRAWPLRFLYWHDWCWWINWYHFLLLDFMTFRMCDYSNIPELWRINNWEISKVVLALYELEHYCGKRFIFMLHACSLLKNQQRRNLV